MRVLGVDPGFATMGVAVVERRRGQMKALSIGALRSPRGETQAVRLSFLWNELSSLIAKTGPDVMAIERVFFNANVRTAMAVGQASGIALGAAAQAGLDVHEYTPPEVKQSVVGVGSATKNQVQTMVAEVLGLDGPPRPADAADACALAICHINRGGLAAALAKQVAR